MNPQRPASSLGSRRVCSFPRVALAGCPPLQPCQHLYEPRPKQKRTGPGERSGFVSFEPLVFGGRRVATLRISPSAPCPAPSADGFFGDAIEPPLRALRPAQ
jgi:hypothetical protein